MTGERCMQCGAPMVATVQDFDYSRLSGLRVTLHDVTVARCTGCDEDEVELRRSDELHAHMARAVIGKPGGLSGSEVRFLRDWLGHSSKDLAAMMGVDPATLSRWESGAQPVGPVADRLVRLIANASIEGSDYAVARLRDIGERTPPIKTAFRLEGKRWREVAPARAGRSR